MSDTLDESQPAHAPFGPSAAEAYTTCLDYVNANMGLPDLDLKVAAEGSVAHWFSDTSFHLGTTAFDWIGSRTKYRHWQFQWDIDDALLLQPGLDEFANMSGIKFGEQRVDISRWTAPGQFGTMDRAVIQPDLTWVADLKWGRGIPVNPVANKQLILYSLGIYWWMVSKGYEPSKRFCLSIDQPRNSGGGGEWRTTLDELMDYGAWIKGRVQEALQPNPPRAASVNGCAFCRRRRAPGGCAEFDRFNLRLLGIDPEMIVMDMMLGNEPLLSTSLTPEQRSYLLTHKGMIEHFLKQLEAGALQDALEGRPTGNHKAVEDRMSPAKYVDEAAAEKALVELLGPDKAHNVKLITVSQAKKIIPKEQFEEKVAPHVKPGTRSIKLVPVEDARPALIPVEQKMEEEDDGQ